MIDNIIRFSEQDLVLLGSLNSARTQVNLNECTFKKKFSLPITQSIEALEICQKLAQNNQASLLVQHQDRISVWIEEFID